VGLSAKQGTDAVELMDARNATQLHLLENEEMSDALSGLAFLRALPAVDARHVSVIGHSFGGWLIFRVIRR